MLRSLVHHHHHHHRTHSTSTARAAAVMTRPSRGSTATQSPIMRRLLGRIWPDTQPHGVLQQQATESNLRKLAKQNPPQPTWYPLAESPHARLRDYAEQITALSSCPTCVDNEDFLPSTEWNDITKLPTSLSEQQPKTVERPVFTCPDCGWPTHCSQEHWEADRHRHAQVCSVLKQWTMDEHDLLSGRQFWEMTFPGRQNIEAILNFSSWPYLLTTRRFSRPILENAVSQRHISRFLTYPYTLASLLHKPWVYYNTKDSVDSTTQKLEQPVPEEEMIGESHHLEEAPAVVARKNADSSPIVTDIGWHLFSSLSHAVDVATKTAAVEFSRIKNKSRRVAFSEEPTAPTMNNDPFRIFIVGARMEAQLPTFVWEQLSMTFPGVPFRLYFIGPDVSATQLPVTSFAEPLQKHRQIFSSGSSVHLREISVTPNDAESADGDSGPTTVQSLVIPASVNLRMEYISAPYEQVHESFGQFQRRRDIFVLFNSGIGHPATRNQWKPAIDKILKTRCMTIFTSLNEEDQQRDVQAIQEDYTGNYVVAMRPCRNKFASLRPDIPADCVHDSRHWVYSNWGLFAIHGVGTEMGGRLEDVEVKDASSKSWWSW